MQAGLCINKEKDSERKIVISSLKQEENFTKSCEAQK